MRLTDRMRNNLKVILLERAFSKQMLAHNEREIMLGEHVYNIAIFKFRDALDKIPKNWFQQGVYFRVHAKHGNGRRVFDLKLSQSRPIPNIEFGVDQIGAKAMNLIRTIDKAAMKINVARDVMRQEIDSILKECVSIEELLERWPAIKPVVVEFEKQSFLQPKISMAHGYRGQRVQVTPSKAVTVNMKVLNKKLGFKS